MLKFLLLAFGLILLIKGADWLVRGAVTVARAFRVSEFVIGLTVVSFGTSLPELIIAIVAGQQGSPDLIIGNVVGSNVANVLLVLGGLAGVNATLTVPGIAGLILSIGMAVDANVLIFERIREELSAGSSPQMAIDAGYGKALSSIADANITTLIAAVVLFTLGTGPIKGFAITLSLGIVTSMFTAIIGTRAVVNLAFGGRRLTTLPV